MPKIVDHEKQRHIVAEAALRVIRRSGLEQASVRKIAEEAGLSVGSMRHYFSTQAELFAFCMNLFIDRVEKRIKAMDREGPVLMDLKRLLLQFLPVDEERMMEMEVWLSFQAKALIYPELQALSDRMHDGMHMAASFVVNTLLEHKLAKPGLDAGMEAEKLYALVDGLAMHRMMRPERLPAERLEAIIDQHLQALCST
ncbi:TetR family transcriptional regulator [Paenibacillus dendritiformis]|uniref:TetR/AcrR family transcriptional regulator n=1 Tax=Paenibacillus dendritiformis TaxID=130049 RepID=UPI00143DFAAE|nr:TetR/AcrR family transcriptional regulator [Paenibacillus dendritiformis]NKI21064.1 TetR family transcriptional regulator [Paenibacillus dendritiformis]NRF97527.1 TetR family transcriptional regulator [Paenibacillus dendritiformis]